MKRRDFITKTSLTAASVGSIISAFGANSINNRAGENSTPVLISNGDKQSEEMPYTEVMNNSNKARSGVVIGGIGAGGAEIRKDGIFYNWSIMNNNPRGTGAFFEVASSTRSNYLNQDDEVLFFVVRYQEEGKVPVFKLLQILEEGYQSAGLQQEHFIYYFPWMSCIEKIEYSARFPFATLKYIDSDMPFDIELKTWSPFIPNDLKNSSLPLLYFDFTIKSKSDKPVDVMIMANYRSLSGYDTPEKLWTNELVKREAYMYSVSGCNGMDDKSSSFGTVGMASLSSESTYNLGWAHRHRHYEGLLKNRVLPNLDQTESRNTTRNQQRVKRGEARNFYTWGKSALLNNGENLNHSFVMGWHFPNLYDERKKLFTGHYYSNFFSNTAEVLTYGIDNKADLYERTLDFVDHFYDSSAPRYVLDMVNSQMTTFITSGQLSKKMDFGVIEGITKHQSWGPVGTTDVNLYASAMTIALFPELQKSTMRVHKAIQHEGGEIRHSFQKGFAEAILNLETNAQGAVVNQRLDLHCQYVIMVTRDFFWTNDKAYLEEMWPSVKRALEYVLNKRDLNGDQQPDITGIMCTYDNFPMYGISSLIQSQWLCAISGAIAASKVLGDKSFENKYKPIFEKGKKIADEKLWNGKYFRLYNSDLPRMTVKDGAGNDVEKDISGIDEGCLTDQLVGQWVAHASGLGNIFDPIKRKAALKSILEISYRPEFGLKNCSWVDKGFISELADDIWVDQANTCWTGVELSFASFLLYEGLYDEALSVIKTVDNRYRKAGLYYDHQEFGGHYFRAMGAWAIINGMAGLGINQDEISLNPAIKDKNFKLFIAFPGGTAHVIAVDGTLRIKVLSGSLKVRKLTIANNQFSKSKVNAMLNDLVLASGKPEEGFIIFDMKKTIIVNSVKDLIIR